VSHDSQKPDQDPVQPERAVGADSLGPEPESDTVDVTESTAVAEMSSQIRALEEELGQMKDRALRVQAELENYQKRVARDMAEQRRYADLPLIRELLPVLDNMLRALEAAEKSGEAPGLLEGFKMVVQQLEGVLERHHCTPIQALHEAFDPNLHEALTQQPSAEYPPNTVVFVASTGYRLHDRVVRPSQVIVSTVPPTNSEGKP
jgi:molecular chaperone GrpE